MARFTQSGSGNGSGVPGPAGPQGPAGSNGEDGVSFLWSAAFDAGTTYPLNYVVSYEGSSYIKVANGGSFPLPTDSNYWNILAEKGTPSFFLGTWNSETEFLAVYQGGPVGLADGDWWAFVKDNTDPNKIYVVREDPNSATGWVIDDNESFTLPAGANGADGADGENGTDGVTPFTYQGAFDYGVTYGPGDAVTFQGGLWKLNNFIGAAGYTPVEGQWTLIIPAGTPGADGADGNDGAPGADGAQGPQGDPGSPGLVYLGNYVSGNGYIANLAVVKGSDNNLYIATSSGGLSDPVGNSAEWSIFLPKGVDGTDGTDGIDGTDGSDGAPGGFGYYGSFYDVQTQAVTEEQQSTGVAVLIRNIDSDATNGFTIIDGSKMKATNAGVYNFAFSFQFHNTGGGGNGTTVEVWFTKNGTAIPDSNTRVTVNTNSPYVVSAWNLFQKLNANDYVQMYWATDNHHIQMTHNTGTMGGPSIPSAIITVNQVG